MADGSDEERVRRAGRHVRMYGAASDYWIEPAPRQSPGQTGSGPRSGARQAGEGPTETRPLMTVETGETHE